MGIEVFFRKDIANILRAVANKDRTGEEITGPGETLVEKGYHKGVQDTLVSIGLAFGLNPVVIQLDNEGSIWIEDPTNG